MRMSERWRFVVRSFSISGVGDFSRNGAPLFAGEPNDKLRFVRLIHSIEKDAHGRLRSGGGLVHLCSKHRKLHACLIASIS
jgi:hypothetical protein